MVVVLNFLLGAFDVDFAFSKVVVPLVLIALDVVFTFIVVVVPLVLNALVEALVVEAKIFLLFPAAFLAGLAIVVFEEAKVVLPAAFRVVDFLCFSSFLVVSVPFNLILAFLNVVEFN